MQSNVIVAEAVGHRARFAALVLAFAATAALAVAASWRDAPRGPDPAERAQKALMMERAVRGKHRCGMRRSTARLEAERAERRAASTTGTSN